MDYGQQNNSNPYAGSQIGAQAQDIREASLRNKADETAAYLGQALNLLDELEGALHGPSPKAGSNVPGPPELSGLRHSLSRTSERGALLVSRLNTLLVSL